MIIRKHLTIAQKKQALALSEIGLRKYKIAKRLKTSLATVYRTLKSFKLTYSVETKPRSGRPRKWTLQDKYRLISLIKRHRGALPKTLLHYFNLGNDSPISLATLRRRLKELPLVYRVPKKNIWIHHVNRVRRMKWCKERKQMQVRDWKNYIFSDESMFVVGGQQKTRIWRTKGEKYNETHCVKKSQKIVSLMVWGAISCSGDRVLVPVEGMINSEKYISIVSENLPSILNSSHCPDLPIFQQDNAPVHVSAKSQEFFRNSNIFVTSWPAQSPDLNIIENLWKILKRKIQSETDPIANKRQLFEIIQKHWLDIPVETIQNLYETMPKRLSEVIRMKGFMSKY